MFNIFFAGNLLLLTVFAFFILFTIRHLLIKSRKFIFLYHLILFLLLFVIGIGGGGAQNDGYARLEQFIALEKKNELELARKNPQSYDSMFQIDLRQFKNSNEFIDYLKDSDTLLDKLEAIFVGWLLVFLAEIAIIIVQLLNKFSKN